MTLTEQYQLAVNRLLIFIIYSILDEILKLIDKSVCSVKSTLINCLIWSENDDSLNHMTELSNFNNFDL